MISRITGSIFLVFLLARADVALSSSPAESRLLPLVPQGAQIVAGIEDPHNPDSKGRLLLVTHNSNLDLQDWIALAGVDPHRRTDEVIEVAASSAEGELCGHLVLLAGRFDRDRIFRAALENHASMTAYRGQDVLVVNPFDGERQQMTAPRWMAILDNRTSIFGSPELVRQALDRYQSEPDPDPMLVQRLRQLQKDVNSWNVLVMSAQVLARHVSPGQLHAPWTHILDGADELTVGIHYGSTARIDFAVHTVSSQNASYLAGLLTEPRTVPVDLSTNMRPRLQNLSIAQDRVHGSFLVPGEQFDRWLASVYTRRSSASSSAPQP